MKNLLFLLLILVSCVSCEKDIANVLGRTEEKMTVTD